MSSDFSSMRREYRHRELLEDAVDNDPVAQFGTWFTEAEQYGLEMPNAMVLATASAQGMPTARYVLLKGFDQQGFVFYSSTVSEKGRQLQQNPNAALLFYWQAMHRQVRIEGTVTQLPAAAADSYFRSRPHGSQVSVWVAPQSSQVEGREELDQRYMEFEQRYPEAVPRPDTWVGYRLLPRLFEFWQGRENRLHDRLQYQLDADQSWHIRRLAP